MDIILIIWAACRGWKWKPLWFWLKMVLITLVVGLILVLANLGPLASLFVAGMQIYVWVKLIIMICNPIVTPEKQ
jgi:hypothetical protein